LTHDFKSLMNKMPTGYPLNQRAVVDKNVVPEIAHVDSCPTCRS